MAHRPIGVPFRSQRRGRSREAAAGCRWTSADSPALLVNFPTFPANSAVFRRGRTHLSRSIRSDSVGSFVQEPGFLPLSACPESQTGAANAPKREGSRAPGTDASCGSGLRGRGRMPRSPDFPVDPSAPAFRCSEQSQPRLTGGLFFAWRDCSRLVIGTNGCGLVSNNPLDELKREAVEKTRACDRRAQT